LAGLAVFSFEVFFIAELLEGASGNGGDEGDVAALTTITTVRSAPGDKLLTSETDAAAPAVAGLDGNHRFIYEFHSA